MSVKTSLQEYYQKRGLPLPLYECSRRGGPDHIPTFVATVTLHDHTKKFKGKGPSKKKAEARAAEKALKAVSLKASHEKSLRRIPKSRSRTSSRVGSKSPGSPTKTLNVQKFVPHRKTCIFIDLENKHLMVEGLLENLKSTENTDILAFASTDHPSLLKLREKFGDTHKQVQLVEIPCTRRDGADVGLILSVGIFLAQENYTHIIIVTGDHFGDALVECISKIDQIWGGDSRPPTATCCRTLESILKALE